MKQTQKILNITPHDFYLIGIASHENDYRLAWALNLTLNLALSKSPDALVFHDKYKHDLNLSVFSQELPEQGIALKLVSNRGDNFILLEEFKNVDFLLKIEGELPLKKLQDMMDKMKAIDIVMGVYPIDTKKIKKIQRISF